MSTRSLASEGEWLYPEHGGKGLRWTESVEIHARTDSGTLSDLGFQFIAVGPR